MPETPEEYAARLATAYKRAETRLTDLFAVLNQWPASIPIGDVNKAAILGMACGALGMIAESHLRASAYDPRPTTQDDGGGK